MIRNHLRFALLVSSTVAVPALASFASFACGGISDPTRGGGSENVATVSGALTGTAVPANAHVALIWRKIVSTTPAPGTSRTTAVVEVGSDVPVVNGKFTMNLGLPAAEYFSSIEGNATTVSETASAPPSAGTASPPKSSAPSGAGGSTSGGGGGFGARLAPRDLVGGSITEPMTAAEGGFVVYIDTNGNGKLDLEGEYASSPDQIIGGNRELILTYLKGGGALDYEKLRDKSGILPAAGFNLAWTRGRWVPLTEVELTLSAKAGLPSAVCSSSGYNNASPRSSGPVDTPVAVVHDGGSAGSSSGGFGSGGSGGSSGSSGTVGKGYPSPTDPNLHCSPDGRSFTYNYSTVPTCPPPPPQPVGLCAGSGWGSDTLPCGGVSGYGQSLTPGQAIPDGWPCKTSPDSDGGPGPGSSSSGSSGTPFDAGSGPG